MWRCMRLDLGEVLGGGEAVGYAVGVAAVAVEGLGDVGDAAAGGQEFGVEAPVAGHGEGVEIGGAAVEGGEEGFAVPEHGAGVDDEVALGEAGLEEGGGVAGIVLGEEGGAGLAVVALVVWARGVRRRRRWRALSGEGEDGAGCVRAGDLQGREGGGEGGEEAGVRRHRRLRRSKAIRSGP